ncbi:MAG: CPBP family intramembrane metalloprotease [Lentisphaeria bacterium]|nr:CPBP family intramembrane metalloprotease [Lentisphaeria bacterium]
MSDDRQRQLNGLFAGGLIGLLFDRIPPFAGHLPPGAGLLLGMALLWAVMRPAPEWRHVACIDKTLPCTRRIGAAALWSIAIFMAVTALNIPCTLIASRIFPNVPVHPFLDATKGLEWRAIPFAAFSLCVVTPIAEELFFRRLLPHFFMSIRISEKPACILAAVIFAAIHLQPAAFLGLVLFGLLLSWQIKKHDLIQPILIHGFYNACVLIVVIAIKLIQ